MCTFFVRLGLALAALGLVAMVAAPLVAAHTADVSVSVSVALLGLVGGAVAIGVGGGVAWWADERRAR